jgi:hypothetical protein
LRSSRISRTFYETGSSSKKPKVELEGLSKKDQNLYPKWERGRKSRQNEEREENRNDERLSKKQEAILLPIIKGYKDKIRMPILIKNDKALQSRYFDDENYQIINYHTNNVITTIDIKTEDGFFEKHECDVDSNLLGEFYAKLPKGTKTSSVWKESNWQCKGNVNLVRKAKIISST